MIRCQSLVLALVIALLQMPAWAKDADQARAAFASITGNWTGELYYLDYQTGQRFGIPMNVAAEVTPDGATLLQKVRFTDPGVEVYAMTLTTVSQESGEVLEAYFREQRGEYLRYRLAGVEYQSAEQWSLVMEREGSDDDRPATIRTTLSRRGDSLDSLKEVRFSDETAGAWFKRNGTELKRVVEAAP